MLHVEKFIRHFILLLLNVNLPRALACPLYLGDCVREMPRFCVSGVTGQAYPEPDIFGGRPAFMLPVQETYCLEGALHAYRLMWNVRINFELLPWIESCKLRRGVQQGTTLCHI